MEVRERNREDTRGKESHNELKESNMAKMAKTRLSRVQGGKKGKSLLKEREEKQRRGPGLVCSLDKRGKTLKGSKKGEFQLPWIVVNCTYLDRGKGLSWRRD